MKTTKLTLSEISPFIRYCHYFSIAPDTPFVDVKPYEYRLIYVSIGKSKMEIDGKSYPAEPGDLFIIPPGVSYSYILENGELLRLYGINFDYTQNNAHLSSPIGPENSRIFAQDKIVEKVEFTDIREFNSVFYKRGCSSLENTFTRIDREFTGRRKHASLCIRGMFISLIAELAGGEDIVSKSSGSEIEMMIEYIKDNPRSDLSNETLGKRFGFSHEHISRLFSKYTGISLHKFVVRQRMLEALSLLQTTNLTVREISQSIGFVDESYFCKVFKNQFGVSPGKYR